MKEFENVVIGTGMGGGVIGYALAKAGKEVLFCEQGKDFSTASQLVHDHFAEEIQDLDIDFNELKKIYSLYGRFCEKIYHHKSLYNEIIIPTLGAITGGSTAIYGMVLERFFPSDFTPDLWPIGFHEIEKFYQMAEVLFRVKGEVDPLKKEQAFDYMKAPSPHPINIHIRSHLQDCKLNPYILPKAFENRDDCTTCQSYLCSKKCKNDVNKICLAPAIQQYNAQLIADLEVLKLEATGNRIQSIRVRENNHEYSIKGKRFFLAAGALNSPKILLNSRSEQHPHGMANSSQLVGKYLMRHLVDIYSLSLNKNLGNTGALKELGLNDFYSLNGSKLGNIQSFGSLPSSHSIINDVYRKLKLNNQNLAAAFILKFRNFIEKQIDFIANRSTLIATTLEDNPYITNCIYTDTTGALRMNYSLHESEKKRLKEFRKIVFKVFSDFNPKIIKMAHKNELLAHACGTCRFGNDPKSSVLNKYNRAHDIENLYIVDSSFFPTSGGTNPALTIAANALRVADHILKA